MHRHKVKQHIDTKLIWRLRMFIVISLVMVCILLYQIWVYDASIGFIVAGIVVGIGIGLIAGRMHKMSRDENAAKIIAKMDRTGLIILILYIGLAIARKQFLGYRVHGHDLLATTLAVATGNMVGRLITMRYGIKKVLMQRVHDIFDKE